MKTTKPIPTSDKPVDEEAHLEAVAQFFDFQADHYERLIEVSKRLGHVHQSTTDAYIDRLAASALLVDGKPFTQCLQCKNIGEWQSTHDAMPAPKKA